MPSATKAAQVRLNRVTPSYRRVVLDNPPLNLMGPEFVLQIREIVTALENDDQVKVVVFESAVDRFFLNHSDFLANFEDLTSIPQGPTGLESTPSWSKDSRSPETCKIDSGSTWDSWAARTSADIPTAHLTFRKEAHDHGLAHHREEHRRPRRGRVAQPRRTRRGLRHRHSRQRRSHPPHDPERRLSLSSSPSERVYTSALVGMRTADLVPLVQPGAVLYPLLAVSGGRYSAMGGGVPVTSDGQVIAGVGVSGGTTEQDAIVEAAMR